MERLTPREREGEFLMLGLRLSKGVDDGDFTQRFGRSLHDAFGETITRLSTLNLVELADGALRLRPAGLPVADAIAAEFLS